MAKKSRPNYRKRQLSRAEAELWSQVAQSATPLDRAQADREIETEDRVTPPVEADHGGASELAKQGGFLPVRRETPEPAPRRALPLAPLDRRETRRIASRRIDVEARIDLHGLRQREAHLALLGFLRRAQSEGLRYVLVITGKGSAKRSGDANPSLGEEKKGVLKQAVPHWLAEPEFGTIVVSYGPAHIRHGGDGALYVRLRRERSST